jgi:hypothetical protein
MAKHNLENLGNRMRVSNESRKNDKGVRKQQIMQWMSGKNVSKRDVYESFDISGSCAGKYLREMVEAGQIKYVEFHGMKYVKYCLANERFSDNVDQKGIEFTIKNITRPRGGRKLAVKNEPSPFAQLPDALQSMLGYKEPSVLFKGKVYKVEDFPTYKAPLRKQESRGIGSTLNDSYL